MNNKTFGKIVTIIFIIFLFVGNYFFQKQFTKINIFDENYLEKIQLASLDDTTDILSMNNKYLYEIYAFLNFKNNFMKSVDIGRFEFLEDQKTKDFVKEYIKKYENKNIFFLKTITIFIVLNKDIFNNELKSYYADLILNGVKLKEGKENENKKIFRDTYKEYFNYFCGKDKYELGTDYNELYTLFSYFYIKNKNNINESNKGYCLLMHSLYKTEIIGGYNLISKRLIEKDDIDETDFINKTKQVIYNETSDKKTITRYKEIMKFNEFLEKTRNYLEVKKELEKLEKSK